MKIAVRVLIMLFSFTSGGSLLGADTYVLYDPSCMDRLEYGYGFTSTGQEYLKYSIRLASRETLILEVGSKEDARVRNFTEGKLIDCSDSELSRDLLNKVREREGKVFVVEQLGSNRYQVAEVEFASFLQQGNSIVYDAGQYGFRFSPQTTRAGQEVSQGKNEQLQITYRGTTDYECASAYVLRRSFQLTPNSYTDLILVPGLGIVVERPNTSSNNTYQVRQINGQNVSSFMQDFCLRTGSRPVAESDSRDSRGGSQSWDSSGQESSQSQGANYHIVEKGETLYSISRKYNVSVEELRRWNGLGNSNLIKPGRELRVSPSSAMAERGSDDRGGGFQWRDEREPASAGDDSVEPWDTTSGYHIVRPGETVALLALRYGYTEKRFRDMNNLGRDEFIKAGQRLKTSHCPSPGETPQDAGYRSSWQDRGVGAGSTSDGSESGQQGFSDSEDYPVPYNDFSLPRHLGRERDYDTSTASTPPTERRGSYDFEPYGGGFSSLDQERRPEGYGAYRDRREDSEADIYPNTDYYPPQSYADDDYTAEERTRGIPQEYGDQPRRRSGFGTPIPQTGNYRGYDQQNDQQMRDPFSPEAEQDRQTDYSRNRPQSYDAYPTGNPNRRSVHRVKEGENLKSIARRYNTSVERLRRINNMDKNEVVIPFQKIYIE